MGSERTGELITTALDGVDGLDGYLARYLPQIAFTAAIPLIILVAVFPQSLVAGIVVFATAPLLPIFTILIGRAAEARTKRQWAMLQLLGGHLHDVLQGLVTLQLYGRSRHQIQVIAEVGEQHRLATMSTLRLAFLSALALEFLASLSTAMVAVAISLALLMGQIGFTSALFILVLVPEFYTPLRALGAELTSAGLRRRRGSSLRWTRRCLPHGRKALNWPRLLRSSSPCAAGLDLRERAAAGSSGPELHLGTRGNPRANWRERREQDDHPPPAAWLPSAAEGRGLS